MNTTKTLKSIARKSDDSIKLVIDDIVARRERNAKRLRDAVAHAYDNAIEQLVARDIDAMTDDELEQYADLLLHI